MIRIKAVVFLWLMFFTMSIKAQNESADSVVLIVLNALTSDQTQITEPVKKYLTDGTWEALAYWEMNAPKELSSLNEAVGDRYSFALNGTFKIRLIDPEDGSQVGLTIDGTYQIVDKQIVLLSKAGKTMEWKLHLLDSNYLILETDDLRIFYTKDKSYFSYD